MNTRHLPITAVVLALAGCAAPGPVAMGSGGSQTDTCTGTCDVTVAVKWNPDTSCSITSPLPTDKLFVGRANQPTLIKWTISGDNAFKFGQPGIAFDKSSGKPPSQVMAQNGTGVGRVVTLTDNSKDDTTKGSWAYSIYVTDGRVTCQVDPFVVNE